MGRDGFGRSRLSRACENPQKIADLAHRQGRGVGVAGRRRGETRRRGGSGAAGGRARCGTCGRGALVGRSGIEPVDPESVGGRVGSGRATRRRLGRGGAASRGRRGGTGPGAGGVPLTGGGAVRHGRRAVWTNEVVGSRRRRGREIGGRQNVKQRAGHVPGFKRHETERNGPPGRADTPVSPKPLTPESRDAEPHCLPRCDHGRTDFSDVLSGQC